MTDSNDNNDNDDNNNILDSDMSHRKDNRVSCKEESQKVGKSRDSRVESRLRG